VPDHADIVRIIWTTAQEMGLTRTWQFWAVVSVVFFLVVAGRIWPSKPGPDGAPPFPLQGGEPGNAGSLPLDQKPPESYL